MFTGIVTDVGTVIGAQQRGDLRLRIRTGYDLATVDLGASIACSGVCLTVVDKGDGWFAVDASAETVSRTAADMWREGARLNLERPLRMGDELGGHIVTGHVDSVGEGKSSFGYVGLDAIADAHGLWVPRDGGRLGVDRLEVYERVR